VGQVQLNDRVFLALAAGAEVRPGSALHLVEAGRRVRGHGRVFQPTGIVRVEVVEGGLATAVVEQVYRMATPGNLVLPLPELPFVGGRAVAERGPEGTIVAFQQAAALHMTEDIAFLSLGRAAGVRVGDEFAAVLPRAREPWGVRPEIEVARLRVVRVDERTSTARVVALRQPALRPGMAVRRVARIP
jgi:hypothetical protein